MKVTATEVLNRICKDEMIKEIPIVYLCRTVVLALKVAKEIEEEKDDERNTVC